MCVTPPKLGGDRYLISHCNMCTLSVDRLFFPVCHFSLLLDFHKETITLLHQPSFLAHTHAIFIMLKIYVCMFAHVHTRSGQPCPPFKIIVLDEADSMTTSAQVSTHLREKGKNQCLWALRRRLLILCVCVCVAGCFASYNGEGIENNSFLPHMQLHQQVRPNPSVLSW